MKLIKKSWDVISFDAYDTILSTKSNLEEISKVLLKNTGNQSMELFWVEFSKAMDYEFEQMNKYSFQKVSFLYRKALNSKNVSKYINVSIDEAIKIIYQAHANASAINGIQDLISILKEKYTVIILSDADNDCLNNALMINNIDVDIVVTSEIAKGYKINSNLNVFQYFLSHYNYGHRNIVHIGDSKNDKIGCERYEIDFLYFNPFNRPSDILDSRINSLSEIRNILI
jgi:FMN phosphatase YigB (HAD superfamily)